MAELAIFKVHVLKFQVNAQYDGNIQAQFGIYSLFFRLFDFTNLNNMYDMTISILYLGFVLNFEQDLLLTSRFTFLTIAPFRFSF